MHCVLVVTPLVSPAARAGLKPQSDLPLSLKMIEEKGLPLPLHDVSPLHELRVTLVLQQLHNNLWAKSAYLAVGIGDLINGDNSPAQFAIKVISFAHDLA